MAESAIPAEWFARGDQDIQAAEILLVQNGPLAIVAFLVQQAIEMPAGQRITEYYIESRYPIGVT
ncbi:MAG: hypothetical protein QW828_07555, partial [Candidatus Bathyarchaeia archaeon]